MSLNAASDVFEEDDAAMDISTAYTMTVGSTFFGEVNAVADRDWVAVTLTAGQTYNIDLKGAPSGVGTLTDTILAIYDATGTYLDGNDDGGNGAESFLSFTASTTGTYYVMGRGYQSKTGTYELSISAPPVPAVMAGPDTLATYLTDGYWAANGSVSHSFNTATITVNIDALTGQGQQLARWALEAWEAVADVEFTETSGAAQITFDDVQTGARAQSAVSGSDISHSTINIGTQWLADNGTKLGSYSFQTYLHEVGHALGLGHQGNYDGNASYGSDNAFINDSWQLSVMSYFDQTQNTSITASHAEAGSAMLVDVLAIQSLYGAAGAGSLSAGATTYGLGHSLGSSWLGLIYDGINAGSATASYEAGATALTIYDASGYDIVDFSNDASAQSVDLNGEAISDVYGHIGNLVIARGTRIEEFRAGSGNDTVTGNAYKNVLIGNNGNDDLSGESGRDRLFGDLGKDTLDGGNGADVLSGGTGTDELIGGRGDDILKGGAAGDVLDGGAGIDLADYNEATFGLTADLQIAANNTGDARSDTYTSIENLRGTDFDDTLRGNVRDNVITGERGNDRIEGRGGDDTIGGGVGEDNLIGQVGNDTLDGGGGRDRLAGGDGNDTMTGGAGQDTFVFDGGADVITDFTNDLLHLDDALWGNANLTKAQILDFASVVAGDTVFDFGGGNTLTLEDYTDIAGLTPVLSDF